MVLMTFGVIAGTLIETHRKYPKIQTSADIIFPVKVQCNHQTCILLCRVFAGSQRLNSVKMLII